MSTISNERLEELANGDMEVWYSESQAMARELLALRKERERAEHVAWMLTDNEFGHSVATKAGFTLNFYRSKGWGVTPLYTAPPAPVVPERDQVRADHAEWSKATFGSVGPIGPLKHLSKKALEAAAAPGDLSEWADMQFLLWDAQRRAGITDEKITQAMIDKLEVNKARQWPEPKDGEPRPHIQAETDTTSQQFESLAGKAVVPEGWKLVPIELTKEMRGKIHPFAEALCHGCGREVVADCEDNVTASWNDMLAVAPEPCK